MKRLTATSGALFLSSRKSGRLIFRLEKHTMPHMPEKFRPEENDTMKPKEPESGLTPKIENAMTAAAGGASDSRLEEAMKRLSAGIDRLKKTEKRDLEARRREVAAILEAMEKVLTLRGARKFDDVQKDMFGKYKHEPLILRREDPVRLLSAIARREPLEIGFDPDVGRKYANATVSDDAASFDQALRTALAEGFGHIREGGIAAIVASERGDLSIEDAVPEELKNIGGLDRRTIRSVEGRIPPDDVKFVVLRVPRKFFPEDRLTEEEEERDQPMIYRGFGW